MKLGLNRFFSSRGKRRDFLRRTIGGVIGGTMLAGPLASQRASARSPVRTGVLSLDPFVGEIMIFAGNFPPVGYAACEGQLLPISQNTALFSLIGTYYGGDGRSNFALPDLRGRVPIGFHQGPGLTERFLGEASGTQFVTLNSTQIPSHSHILRAHSDPGTSNNPVGKYLATNAEGIGQFGGTPGTDMSSQSVGPTGGDLPHNNMSPYLALNFCIALQGIFPPRSSVNGFPPALESSPFSVSGEAEILAQPYIGEMKLFAGDFAPAGWAFCDGHLFPIAEYEALFALIGTTYGGDGQLTFALPDLRSRVPLSADQGPGLTARQQGEIGGAEQHTLNLNEIPSHTHPPLVSSAVGTSVSPAGKVLAANTEGVPQFGTGANGSMNSSSIGPSGGSQPHDNMPPYLGMNYIISLFGIFPSQS